jgi:histidine ammonia-lyase
MTVDITSRADLTLAALRRVALAGENVRLTGQAMERVTAAHRAFHRFLDSSEGAFVYGITSGHGPDAGRRYTLAQARERLGRPFPWQGLAFGGGYYPESLSRGVVFASLGPVVEGYTGAHPARARRLAALLDGPLPRLPVLGLSAAGELLPRFAIFPGGLGTPDEGFAAGWLNGSQTQAVMAALAALAARPRLEITGQVLALSAEAFQAPLDAYDPALTELWGDEHEAAALRDLSGLLRGASSPRRRYQAPVSYRILPRVLGQARRVVAGLERCAAASLRSVGCNPVYLPPSPEYPLGRVLSTGGFHNHLVPGALDAVTASWVDLASLAHRHIVKLHKGRVSLLPDRLLPPGTDYTTGRSTTYLEYVPGDFVAQMRRLAEPSLLASQEAAASDQDDVAIAAPEAFRAEREVAGLLDHTLAVLAVTCSQALHVTGRPAPPALRGLLEQVRTVVPPVESVRRLGAECERLSDVFSTTIEAAARGGREVAWPSVNRTATDPDISPRRRRDPRQELSR